MGKIVKTYKEQYKDVVSAELSDSMYLISNYAHLLKNSDLEHFTGCIKDELLECLATKLRKFLKEEKAIGTVLNPAVIGNKYSRLQELIKGVSISCNQLVISLNEVVHNAELVFNVDIDYAGNIDISGLHKMNLWHSNFNVQIDVADLELILTWLKYMTNSEEV